MLLPVLLVKLLKPHRLGVGGGGVGGGGGLKLLLWHVPKVCVGPALLGDLCHGDAATY